MLCSFFFVAEYYRNGEGGKGYFLSLLCRTWRYEGGVDGLCGAQKGVERGGKGRRKREREQFCNQTSPQYPNPS